MNLPRLSRRQWFAWDGAVVVAIAAGAAWAGELALLLVAVGYVGIDRLIAYRMTGSWLGQPSDLRAVPEGSP